MNSYGKKIGIWGFGVMGKSAARYLSQYGPIGILDQKEIPESEKAVPTRYPIEWYRYDQRERFFQEHEYIIPSPGVTVRDYPQVHQKLLSELDLFASHYHNTTIGVTGSVGKTTVVSILEQLLRCAGHTAVAAGNIGLCMLDLLSYATPPSCTVLELSSFQLEHSHIFAPSLAIITNVYPNHLDRHGSYHAYLQSKLNLLHYQTEGQHALIPWDIQHELPAYMLKDRSLCFFTTQTPPVYERAQVGAQHFLFFVQDGSLVVQKGDRLTHLCSLADLPSYTFLHNWLILIATLSVLHIPITPALLKSLATITIPEHRMECVATKQGITFYNDSKATIPHATLAALDALAGQTIILFLGGVSKGVDRSALLAQLRNRVRYVIYFGAEAHQLHEYGKKYDLQGQPFSTLEDAFAHSMTIANPRDTVLFSPAGASFDLFAHYQERGNRFKSLVHQLPTP
jgi:UDP-N-acetylmuramoylalanine--D-glutamate ligase